MTLLDLVLAVKIAATGLFVALPLLVFPSPMIAGILKLEGEAIAWMRLYGVAVLALLVGYSFGFSQITGPELPIGILCMGIVSNGLGCMVLVATGLYRNNRMMTFLIGAIAIALAFCLVNPGLAMTPL